MSEYERVLSEHKVMADRLNAIPLWAQNWFSRWAVVVVAFFLGGIMIAKWLNDNEIVIK